MLRLHAVLDLLVDARNSLIKKGEPNNPPRIVASGNGLVNNRCWMQMLADCSQMNVIVDGETDEATSRGAAYYAVLGLRSLNMNNMKHEDISPLCASTPNESTLTMWKAKADIQEYLIDGVSSTWN